LEFRVQERTAALTRSNEQLQQRSEQLGRLAAELTLTEQRERQRLARLLHDHLQQLLVAGKLNLGRLTRYVKPPATIMVAQLNGILDEALAASRSLTVQLAPPVLYDEGFVSGLVWLAHWMLDTHGLKVELDVAPDAEPEREDLKILLFESVRELLFNTVKHAGVDKAQVSASRTSGDILQVVVSDEGAGFDPEVILRHGRRVNGGFGLFSVRERLVSLGGAWMCSAPRGRGAGLS
jgi:signal transduction histidine kinase